MGKIVFPLIILIIIILLIGCEFYINENYPILRIESENTVIGKPYVEKDGFEYTISGILLNHGTEGQYSIKVFVFQIMDGKLNLNMDQII